jgi:hypothetical protein
MIKRPALAICLLSIVCCSQAQFDTSFIKANIRRCADSLTHAFKTRNWELFTLYSYPGMVGTFGGKKEFRSYIEEAFNQVPDSAWKKYEQGKILQIVKSGRDFQAIVELHSIIEWQGMKVTSTDLLIGESWDGGMFWTFFDSQGDANAASVINPGLSKQLIIPKKMETKEPISDPIKPKAANK